MHDQSSTDTHTPTLSYLLSTVALAGREGIDPRDCGLDSHWGVQHLQDLRLVHHDWRGRLVASTERGVYPMLTLLGKFRPNERVRNG